MSKSAIMSRVLVAYATRMDSTREIAVAIADELRRLGHQVTVTPCPTSVSLAKFDAVLVGSAVYGRRWLPEAVQFLAARQDSLQDRMVWLFQSGPCGTGPDHAFHTELRGRSGGWRARSVQSTSRSRAGWPLSGPARGSPAGSAAVDWPVTTATGTPSVRGPGR